MGTVIRPFLLLLVATLVDEAPSRARTPKPPLCPPGRYLVDGDPLLDPTAPRPDVIEIADDGSFAVASGCEPVAGKRKATRKGTKLAATWQEDGCPAVAGKVKLKGRIDPTCAELAGTVKARRASPKIKRAFTATLSTCGDGVLDTAGGEECETAADCLLGASCTTCACTTGSSSTTTVTTTSTFPSSTQTSTTTDTSTTQPSTTIVASTVTTSSLVTTTSLATTTTTSTSTTTTTFPDAPPPDPSSVAPPLDPAVATGVGAAAAFLHSGPTLIQFGVQPGTIVPHRAVVVRGTVRERDGGALSAVVVSVRNHPELGATLTRADGMFDLAVNGGGSLVLDYEKAGYLPAQRQLELDWNEFVAAPDVALIPLDPAVTTVDLGVGVMQVAQGSEVTDDDGTRRATVLVPPGTGASLVLPDGSEQPVGQLSLRATEYTVGASGPDAMPGLLPPTSGYTYAVELSADEALAAGATTVHFDRPLPFYVENFLGFPVGGIVPAGFYDRERSVWVPSENGRVIRVLGATGGIADLDTDGDDVADDGSALGVTTEERERLATLYAPDTTLWRVPITHFSPCDLNWPMYFPPDADYPRQRSPEVPRPDVPCAQTGSTIGCQDQTLGEALPVTGSAFALHYSSHRARGRRADYQIEIPLSGDPVPASLDHVELEVEVAGQLTSTTFPPAANQTTTFTWDGLDVYGRPAQGRHVARVRVGFFYDLQIAVPDPSTGYSFGLFSPQPGTSISQGSRLGSMGSLWQEFEVRLGVLDALGAGLGGWTLAPHHAFDPAGGVLHLGDGTRQSAEQARAVVRTVGGRTILGGQFVCGTGVPATSACISGPFGVAVAPDGSVYVAATYSQVVYRIGQDGLITIAAGRGPVHPVQGGGGYSGDGGAATSAQLNGPSGIGFGPDGTLYFNDRVNARIRRVGTDGIIDTVVQYNTGTFFEGGPLAVGPDGALYYWELGANGFLPLLRRRDPSGEVSTIAGSEDPFLPGDCDACSPTSIRILNGSGVGIAVGPDGGVFFTNEDNHVVYRIGPDGVLRRFAGMNGMAGSTGDGGPARAATLENPVGLAVGRDGSVYIGDSGHFIRRVGPDGIITSVAGTGQYGSGSQFRDTDTPAGMFGLTNVYGLAEGPDGSIYFSDFSTNRVRRLGRNLASAGDIGRTAGGDFFVPSKRGDELYVFDVDGRHVRTLDAATGGVRFAFEYALGGLSTVTDAGGLVTRVERDGSGRPTAIVAPGGQRTSLAVDGEGYLQSVTNPAGEEVDLGYGTDGLLTSLRDPSGGEHLFEYDGLGRLIRDADPAGGDLTLGRIESAGLAEVTVTSALGRSATYLSELQLDGNVRFAHTDAAGTSTETIVADDSRTVTHADGTTAALTLGPDPRFGMGTPFLQRLDVETPGGRHLEVTAARTAVLDVPREPFSLRTLTTSVAVNGRTYTSTFDAPTRRTVSRTPAGRQVTTTVDPVGRLVEAEVSGLLPVRFAYDASGRLVQIEQGTGAALRALTLAYDAANRVASVTDPLAHSVALTYDDADRIVRAAGSDGAQVDVGYDARGNPTSIAPPGSGAHVLGFNPVDLLSSYTPPGGGAVGYAHDADRRLATVTRADGDTVGFGFDAAGRLATRTTVLGTDTFSYDVITGAVTSIAGPDGSLSFDYDGFLETGETWSGAIAGAVTRAFDDDMRVAEVSVNGTAVDVRYDADGLVVGAGVLDVTRSAQNGLVTGTTAGIVTTAHGVDGFGEPASLDAAAGGTPLLAVDYTRDALGRLVTKVETVQGVTETIDYAYDASGRLVEVRQDGSVIASYTWDENGNRTERDEGGGSIVATYDGDDRLLTDGGTTFAHTADGERSTRTAGGQATTYVYDALGNLITVDPPSGPTIEYVADARGRRIGKRVGGTLVQGFLWDDTRLVAELDGAGQVVSRFVYATHPTVPDLVIRGGATYRVLADHLGSPLLVVDVATGAVAQRLRYDAFGRVENDSNSGFQPFGFAGGLYDPDTELLRFGARDYDPRTGRWTTRDPILFLGQDTNLYLYAYGDPVNFVDPDGLAPLWAKKLSNFVAGFGDTLSFGLTRWIRDQWEVAFDLGPTVFPCQQGFYTAGELAGTAYALAMGKIAPTPAAASADLNWAAISGRMANARAGRYATVNRAFDTAFGVSF